MKFRKIERENAKCVVVENEETIITDADSALELLINAKYEAGKQNIVIDKNLVNEDFFVLSTGLAGEILQ